MFTDLPDFSLPIINSLNVGFAKYQFRKPDIKENIFYINVFIYLNK